MQSSPQKLLSRMALWAVTIRDSFVILLPLTFFGVTATLLGNFPVPAIHRLLAQVFGAGWQAATQGVVDATYGVFGLALAVVLSIRLARRLPLADGQEALPPASVGIGALVNFMLCVAGSSAPTVTALGHQAMLLGIVIGIATPEILRPLAALRTIRRLAPSYDSDPTFYHVIRMCTPLAIVSLAVMLTAEAARSWPALQIRCLAALPAAINNWIDADWLLNAGAVLVNQCLWFVGISGGNVLDQRAQALFGPAGAAYDPALGWRPLIDTFVHLGGSGATLGLMLALFIVAREGPHRRIARMSLLPSLFNINELLIFGLPIALNPMFLMPFLLAPVVLTAMALVAVHTGLVPLHNPVVPWTTPLLLSGYLLTDSWRGAALQGTGLLASTLIYLPFARRAEGERMRDQAEAFDAASRAIVSEGQRRVPSIRRSDQVGLTARGLFAALTHDIGTPALALAFQPKHDRRGVAVGVEALLRWTHGRHGPVPAGVAVTLAEEGGLIRRLGAWALEEACACKAQWNAHGLSRITMAINVSPLQLGDPQLPALLARCLERHRLAPGEIELEITESQSIPVHRAVDDNLAQIVAMGVSLAMDDFGMGYSSLLHMRRFPVHAIKIDGSLTRDVLTNPTSAAIIRTIAALGRMQQVEVVAEFVETAEQRDALASLGCDVFQGYLHSPALSGAACGEYLLAHATRAEGNVALIATPTFEIQASR
jgi:lactose/cellobiose-specific phosphotransferase system IIC component